MGFFNLPAGVPGGALKPDGRRRPMDSKPGVLFFMTDFVTGGVERVLADVVNNLTENGCRAAIVFDGVCERNEIFKSINPAVKCYFTEEMVGIHTGMKPKRDSILKKKLWRWKRRISEWRRRNLRRYIPDFDSYDYLVDFKNGHSRPWRVKKNQGQKLVLWIHGSYASCWKPRLIRKFHYAAYDRLVCLTKRFEQGVFHDYPDFVGRVTQIYNAIGVENIRRQAGDASCLTPEEKELMKQPYFLSVCRLDRDKDLDTLIRGYARFAEKCPQGANLVLAGSGECAGFCRELADNLGCGHKVFLVGNQKNPFVWMKNCRAMVLASKSEGFGMVLAEAQACGALVVSADCPDGPAEILQNGESGLLFEPGNVSQLAGIFERIEKDEVDRENILQRAEKGLERFSREKNGKALMNLFK